MLAILQQLKGFQHNDPLVTVSIPKKKKISLDEFEESGLTAKEKKEKEEERKRKENIKIVQNKMANKLRKFRDE